MELTSLHLDHQKFMYYRVFFLESHANRVHSIQKQQVCIQRYREGEKQM